MVFGGIPYSGNYILDLDCITNLFQISLINERLECIMVQQRFGGNLVEIEKKLNNFKHVCDMLIRGQGTK